VSVIHYIALIRLNKPIGIFLLLWPCLFSLWLAADGIPDIHLIIIFIVGAAIMRSAGCIINDIADKNIDIHVWRTQDRPIASGKITTTQAYMLFTILVATGAVLLLFTNLLTFMVAIVALLSATIYPFTKRFFAVPQFILGISFAFSVPMAFAAQLGHIPIHSWLVYIMVVVWTIMYDTIYALCDLEDDKKISIHSSAKFFGQYVHLAITTMQLLTLAIWILVLFTFNILNNYSLSISLLIILLFIYQNYLIKQNSTKSFLQAFKSNNIVGLLFFISVSL
jgi:4-hydroxybenzoate polyprenyltransferase